MNPILMHWFRYYIAIMVHLTAIDSEFERHWLKFSFQSLILATSCMQVHDVCDFPNLSMFSMHVENPDDRMNQAHGFSAY